MVGGVVWQLAVHDEEHVLHGVVDLGVRNPEPPGASPYECEVVFVQLREVGRGGCMAGRTHRRRELLRPRLVEIGEHSTRLMAVCAPVQQLPSGENA